MKTQDRRCGKGPCGGSIRRLMKRWRLGRFWLVRVDRPNRFIVFFRSTSKQASKSGVWFSPPRIRLTHGDRLDQVHMSDSGERESLES